MSKELRSWFFTTIGDTQIGGFWRRFVGGKISKPDEQTFRNLTDSVAFHTEVNSAAQTDSVGALQNKQGLVIASDDGSAKANSDTALGSTGGTKVPQNRHLPNVIDSVTNQIIRDFNGKPLEVVVDSTGSNNKYSFNLRTAFLTMLSKFLLPTFVEADALKVVKLNAGGTAYELGTIAATGGDTYRGTSATSNSIAKGTKTFTVVPATGTYAVTIGNRIRFSDSSLVTNYVEGIVTAASPTSITITADNTGGTGTIASWTYNLGGDIPSTDVAGVPNLFVSQLGGNDSTGDGSIIKPFATLAYAQSLVVDKQTIIMFGGNYTNNINIVKAGISYTLFCFPGVFITQTTTSFYNSLASIGRVDILGEPNIDSSALTTLPTFVVHEIAKLELGNIVAGIYRIFDIYSRGNNLGQPDSSVTTENTEVSFISASWKTPSEPAILLLKATGASAFGNGTIFLNCKSLEFVPLVANASPTYLEISNPYTVTLTGNFQFRGTGTLLNPNFIRVTSTSFGEIAINKLTCRLGGAGVTGANIINLGSNNISALAFFCKDIVVSVRPATFVTASVASSFYAENVYMEVGSTIQGGSATIKTMAPAHANTRTFITSDATLATPFNI